jgi:hypothetical protein
MTTRRSSRIEKDNGSSFHHPKREKSDPEPAKKALTCISCRTQKKKCDGLEPCGRCAAKKQQCSYVVQVENKEMQSKVEEMDALQRRLSDITASVEEKRRIHDELDKQREDLKQEYLHLSKQVTDRSAILFTPPNKDRNIQFLDHYQSVFYPTTKNIMPYDKATDFLHDENHARFACMCAMLANGSLIVGDMNNSKHLFAQAKQALLKCLEKPVVADMFLYTSTLADLGTHCMAFCDLHNARAFFYKIIELARNFPQQFFSNDTQASRSSFVLAAVPDGVKANAGSAAYHLGYAYESLLVICADKELDDVQLSVANNPTLIRTHARFHELRTHLDKLNQIAIIFSYENSTHLFNWLTFSQELHHTKQKIDMLDPAQYAYLVGLEKVVRMNGYLAAKKSQDNPLPASNVIEEVIKYAKKSLEQNKANLLAFAMLYAAIVCRHYLNADAMVLLRMRKEIEAETSGVDLASLCLQEYEQTVAQPQLYRVNPYFEKFSLHLDTRQRAQLKPADLRRFALPKATMQQLVEICDYSNTSADE